MQIVPIRRALVSVSDKTGVAALAQKLAAHGAEIVSTGGTAAALTDAGVPVVGISDLTGFPEMLDGRVKTLHPNVHGGILARRDLAEHTETIEKHGIAPIDLVCVNLYPFAATIAKPGVTLGDAIENIDIGGPAMVRSAAKNHDGVAIVTDPLDYDVVLAEIETHGGVTLATRRRLAAKAFAHTAAYDAMIATYLEKQYAAGGADTTLPETFRLSLPRSQVLRYGENPHQSAALYRDSSVTEPCIGNAVRRDNSGKETSFNNLYDLDGALELVKEFGITSPAAAIIKHANPCGCAVAETLAEAFGAAREADTVSAFGGILAVNRSLDAATAARITEPNNFFECIVAPGYEDGVVETLTTKRKWGANLRLLEVAPFTEPGKDGYTVKQIVGGLLVSTRDYRPIVSDDLTYPTERKPTPEELAELLFAWRVVKHVKSNAIVIAKGNALRGVGAGQMNRVRSVRLAVEQAGEHAIGAVLASDAFFPFADGPETAANAGVTSIVQPGGSVRDAETIALCNERGIAMVFTGVRHFRH
ncbi:MAG: bifunctional phosphoribosylaminoimidazolecarboxamide formyltransferase/IMP cyclohydrolase [Armatimonadetes bacterium]|nr:bifunctional phosphoribosylaminoimidazolecarboxamide formyltransferase/IMP cyclohydrolase [Armatimonadota bacterium]